MTSPNPFASFPGPAPTLALPPGEASRIQASFTGMSSSAAEFATAFTADVMSRGTTGANHPSLLEGLPGIVARATTTMDAGVSRLAQRGDQPKHYAIMGKPRREGPSWDDGGYDEYALLWNAVRDDPTTTRTGHTLSNICGLNYYCELAQVIRRASATLVSRVAVPALRKQYALDRHYAPESARDFVDKWKLLGPISRRGEGTFNGADMPTIADQGYGERLVQFVYDGAAETHQLFSSSGVRAGDKLYMVTTKIRNPYNAFYLPNGAAASARSGTAGEELLQVRGFSSSELSYVPGDSSGGGAGEPLDDDANYIERAQRAATNALRYDWDDERDTFRVVNVAAEEGFSEAQEYLTSVEYEAYMSGYVEPIGIAIETLNGSTPSQRMIDAAHRSPAALTAIQTVRYLVARKLK